MDPYSILIMNGPNLGYLGRRQPEIYGSTGMDQVPGMVRHLLGDGADRVSLSFFQSNSEGGMIDRLEQAWEASCDGVVLNAGAYTHTSLALADCLAWISIPTVEVHISNILARSQGMRHESLLARHCVGLVAGFGVSGYALAVQALLTWFGTEARAVESPGSGPE
jgi:3-dehydroquinate dehydratase-2